MKQFLYFMALILVGFEVAAANDLPGMGPVVAGVIHGAAILLAYKAGAMR